MARSRCSMGTCATRDLRVTSAELATKQPSTFVAEYAQGRQQARIAAAQRLGDCTAPCGGQLKHAHRPERGRDAPAVFESTGTSSDDASKPNAAPLAHASPQLTMAGRSPAETQFQRHWPHGSFLPFSRSQARYISAAKATFTTSDNVHTVGIVETVVPPPVQERQLARSYCNVRIQHGCAIQINAIARAWHCGAHGLAFTAREMCGSARLWQREQWHDKAACRMSRVPV